MKDSLGRADSPSLHAPGRKGLGWWDSSLPSFPSVTRATETPKTGCMTCRGTSGGSMDPQGCSIERSHSHLPTGTTGLQPYFPPLPRPVRGLRSPPALRSSPQIQSQAESLLIPTNSEVGRKDVPKPEERLPCRKQDRQSSRRCPRRPRGAPGGGCAVAPGPARPDPLRPAPATFFLLGGKIAAGRAWDRPGTAPTPRPAPPRLCAAVTPGAAREGNGWRCQGWNRRRGSREAKKNRFW